MHFSVACSLRLARALRIRKICAVRAGTYGHEMLIVFLFAFVAGLSVFTSACDRERDLRKENSMGRAQDTGSSDPALAADLVMLHLSAYESRCAWEKERAVKSVLRGVAKDRELGDDERANYLRALEGAWGAAMLGEADDSWPIDNASVRLPGFRLEFQQALDAILEDIQEEVALPADCRAALTAVGEGVRRRCIRLSAVPRLDPRTIRSACG